MEEKHRIIIQKNFLELTEKVDINKLLPKLIQKNVYSSQLAEPYLDIKRREKDRLRDLFLGFNRRGPKAFEKLIESLEEIGDYNHNYLAYLLQEKDVTKLVTNSFQRIDINKNHPTLQQPNEEENEDHVACMQPPSSGLHPPNSSIHPFILPTSERPAHIRQLSQELPYAYINIRSEPLKVVVRKATKFMDDPKAYKVPVYPMRKQCRGTYLGINNMDFINDVHPHRKGAEYDEENLKVLFKQMGFTTSSYRNQTYRDMTTTIKNFRDGAHNKDLKHADCLVVAIMSHGTEGYDKENSYVVTTDNKVLSISWILDQFDNCKCPEMRNKPKIFFLQICRGDNPNIPIHITNSKIQADGGPTTGILRSMTDYLIGYATLPGDCSYRDIDKGTWYIQLICEIFMNHAYDTDVQHLLQMVDDRLKNLQTEHGYMQTSCFEVRAFKICYLHPGLYEKANESS